MTKSPVFLHLEIVEEFVPLACTIVQDMKCPRTSSTDVCREPVSSKNDVALLTLVWLRLFCHDCSRISGLLSRYQISVFRVYSSFEIYSSDLIATTINPTTQA